MTPEQLQSVERLFELAAAKDTLQRDEFLAHACQGDDLVRTEVESLLAHREIAGAEFMEASSGTIPKMNLASLGIPVDQIPSDPIAQLMSQQSADWEAIDRLRREMRRRFIEQLRKTMPQSTRTGAGSDHEPAPRGYKPSEVIAIDEALVRLEVHHPRKAQIVEFRYFAGMTAEETATVLDISARAVDSDWQFAKAWLYRELTKGTSHGN